ncbi:MAG: type 2 lanthipeptide synthetase LanM [Acidobacteriota bacterium]
MSRSDTDHLQIAVQIATQIAARARHLEEHLRNTQPRTQASSRLSALLGTRAQAAWARWSQAVAKGDVEALERRLAWERIDSTDARRALEHPAAIDSVDLPEWLGPLTRVLEQGVRVGHELRDQRALPEVGLFDVNAQPPFLELLVPFLRHAREQFTDSRSEALLAPLARQAFDRQLLVELATIGASAHYESFTRLREQSPGEGVYRRFITQTLDDGGGRFYAEYSTLARQLTHLALTWSEGLAELLDRLEQDRGDLGRVFAGGADPGVVTAAAPGLSDRHDGGRRVCRLTFADGLSLYYKPRDIRVEDAFHRLLDGVAADDFEPAPPSLRILSRDGYGWVEAAEQTPAMDAAGVERYFRQAGALVAITHVLGGSDLHMDNVVASAAGPVVVDAETLLQPRRAANRPPTATALELAREKLETSVLSTGLLSFFQTDPQGQVYDIGGLSGRGGHRTAPRRQWRRVNSDEMHHEATPARATTMDNVLELDGEAQDPRDHAAALVSGCVAMLRFLRANRDRLLAGGGSLDAFRGLPVRVVFRASNFYAGILKRLMTPECQRHGLEGSMLLETLARPFCKTRHRPQLWPLIVEERRSLLRLDVPRFALASDRTELAAGGETVQGLFAESGFDAARRRLLALDEASILEQAGLLETALLVVEHSASEHSTPVHSTGTSTIDQPAVSPTPLAPLAAADLVWAAEQIGRRLATAAIRGDDGSATWLSPSVLQLAGRSDRGASYHLYDGGGGIALFLATLARVTGRAEHGELARAGLRPMARVLESPNASALLTRERLGACSGLGSAVYVLAISGVLLEDDRLLGLARRAARHITPERIAADRVLDIEGGAAGAVLALLALHDLEPRSWILDRARCCGEHLLACRAPGDSGRGHAWRDASGVMPVGFAHGASGIALALWRLGRRIDDPAMLAATAAAFDYEHSLFDREAGGWPRLESRPGGEAVATFGFESWCRGAPGIALARAAASVSDASVAGDDVTRNNPDLASDLALALEITQQTRLGEDDYLCCGNLGRVEVLLAVGQLLDRRDLVEAARARAAAVLRRGADPGAPDSTTPSLAKPGLAKPGLANPGLFRGVAGIGYTWLRLARPRILPSILHFAHSASRREDSNPLPIPSEISR